MVLMIGMFGGWIGLVLCRLFLAVFVLGIGWSLVVPGFLLLMVARITRMGPGGIRVWWSINFMFLRRHSRE